MGWIPAPPPGERAASIRLHLLALVVVLVLPAAAGIAWLLDALSHQTQRLAVAEVRAKAQGVVSRLDLLRRQHEDLLEALHESPWVRELRPGRCDPRLAEHLDANAELIEITVFDSRGQPLCRQVREGLAPPAVTSPQAVQRELKHRDFHAGAPERDAFSWRWLLPLTKPVFDDQGKVSGLIVARIDLLRLHHRVFTAAAQADPCVIEVSDVASRILLRSVSPEKWVGLGTDRRTDRALAGSGAEVGASAAAPSDAPVLRAGTPVAGDASAGLVLSGSDGTPWLHVAVMAQPLGWHVLASVPEALVTAGHRRLMGGVLVALALAVAAQLALAAWLGGRIAAPLRGLANITLRVSRGETAARADPRGPSELRDLARHVNRMLDVRERDEAALRASEERLQRALDASRLALWDMDIGTGGVYLSAGWQQMLGGAKAETHTTYDALSQRVPADEHPRLMQAMTDALKGKAERYHVEHHVRRLDGSWMWIVSTGRVVERRSDGRALRMVGTNRDITERKRAQALAEGQKQVLESVAAGASLGTSLERLARTVETQSTSGALAVVMRLDAESGCLHVAAAPSLPTPLRAALDGLLIGPLATSCGTAAWRGEPVLVEDIAASLLWNEHGSIALTAGVRACWSVPIHGAEGRVLGTFALYYPTPRTPSERHRWLIDVVVQTAALAIEHDATRHSLEASVRTLERTFEHIDQGISISDTRQRLAGCNRRFRELLHLPESLARPGTPAEAIFRFNAARGDYGAGEIESLVADRLALAKLAMPHRFEREMADGSIVEVRGRPLPEGGFVTTYTDVTERTRQERELRRFRAAMNLSTDAIYLIDAGTLAVLDCNDGACRMLGWPREELVGMDVGRFVVGRPPERLRAEIEQLHEGAPSLTHVRARHRRRDGSEFPVEINRRAQRTDRGVMVVAVVRDISEREAAEAARAALEGQLRESQKMEAIGTLAGGIAHDFNNILGAILGNLALAREDLPVGQAGPAAHPALAPLEQVQCAALRARSLVQQILTFSRRQPQQLRVQALAPLLDETLSLMRATLPAGIAIEMHIAAEPLLVMADAIQVQQVLMNLITNAWHAMNGGHGRITVGLARERELVHLWVQDDGCGIPPDRLPRIFDPFFTTKPVGQGTGLGLAVVHGIVSAHRGSIQVDSETGRGSTFHVRLPLAQAAQLTLAEQEPAMPALPDTAARRGRGQSVLVLDDDEVMAIVAKSLLLREGWRVHYTTEPQVALQRLAHAETTPDLLLTDNDMPGLSGVEVAREAARLRPGLPVILASGFITDALREAAGAAGIRLLLHKEALHTELVPLVAQALAARAEEQLVEIEGGIFVQPAASV